MSLICLCSVSCFAESLYVNVSSTPYDRQMARIQPVLLSKTIDKQNLSLVLVNHWMHDLREIPYGFSMEWKTPAEVQTGAVADCKGKAVALYSRMHAYGAKNVRLVIGRRMLTSGKTHAWLEWATAGGTYVLDPTINWVAQKVNEIADDSYVPYYAYAGSQRYRAAARTSLYAHL